MSEQGDSVAVDAVNFEDALNQVLTLEQSLTEEQRENLSKVLFPETHTNEIELCGKKREVKPLTVKYARMLHAAIMPFVKQAQKAAESNETFALDDETIESLKKSVKVMAEYYGWPEVVQKIDEEDILTGELQAAVVTQQGVQGENDFLLGPLRVLTKLMQVRELLQARVSSSTRT